MKLSIKECLAFGWETFKKRPWFFVKAAVLVAAIDIAFNLVQRGLEEADLYVSDPALVIALVLVSLAVAVAYIYVSIVVMNMGLTKLYLNAHDDISSVRLKDLWAPHPLVKYVLASVLLGLAFIVGLILLIVPGIIIGIAFGFATFIVMDRGLEPIEALKESARITRGNRWRLFLLGLVLLLLNIVGLLALVVGLFVTVPVSFLASVHAYRALSSTASAPAPVV